NHRRRNLLTAVCLAAGFATGMLLFHWLLPGGSSGRSGGRHPAVGASREPLPAATDWNAALGAGPSFNDVTRAAGISFRHENGMTGKYYYPEIMGGGVGLFDFNGDGFLDIYFVNGNRLVDGPSPDLKNRLYRNNGDWSFTDVTDRAGVGDTGYG